MPQYLRHNPIKVEENNIILGGNMRYRALQALAEEHAVGRWTDKNGVEHTHNFTQEIPDEWVVQLTDYTLEDKRRIVLLDNAQNGKDDLERLANEWSEAEINDWGNGLPEDWNQGEAEDEEDLKVEDDEFNEEEEYIEPRTKEGDIWQLGEHRLLCGDSCSKENIVKLMNGTQARLWLTDPPYNVNVKNSQNMKIANDNMESQLFGKFLRDAFSAAEAVLEPGGSFYVWFASKEHINFESALNACGLHVRQNLVWNKHAFILGRQDYQWKHEPCLYGWKDGAAHYFTESRNRTSVIDLAQSLT
jgi:site-specific DNA-methyltransferase (adenine-specific)